MVKYIKVQDGLAINKKEAWIGQVQEKPEIEIIEGFLWTTRIIKEDAKYFFEFGDAKQEFITTCDTKEKALENWEKLLNIINEHQIIND